MPCWPNTSNSFSFCESIVRQIWVLYCLNAVITENSWLQMPEFAIQTPARKIFSSGIFMKSFQPSNRVYSCLNATKLHQVHILQRLHIQGSDLGDCGLFFTYRSGLWWQPELEHLDPSISSPNSQPQATQLSSTPPYVTLLHNLLALPTLTSLPLNQQQNNSLIDENVFGAPVFHSYNKK